MTRMILAAALIALAAPVAASAHAHLVSATPAVDSSVVTAPNELAIDFTEGVEPQFCTVAVTNAGGADMTAGAVHVGAGNNKHLLIPVKTLRPGTYTVHWHATAVDTHKTEGTYHFTVAAAAGG